MTVGFTDKKASRRPFLAGAAAAGAGTVAASAASATGGDPLITEIQEWAQATGDGVDATPYGMPIRFEGDVVRRNVEWLTADTISSINFTPIHALDGTIPPQGCAFERHHSGAIELAKEDYRLMINGLVDQPLVFTYEDLERFPRENHVYFCECAANTGMEWAGAQLNGVQFTHGMIHNMEYTGIPLRTLLNEAGVKTEGKWVFVEGADASSNGRSIPMDKALDDVLVAFKANGEALRKEHGYPVRLVVPGWEDSTLGNILTARVIDCTIPSPDIVLGGLHAMQSLADWYREDDYPTGLLQVGGGIAGDFAICVVPMLRQDVGLDVDLWSWFAQISESSASYGGYSGAPPSEKISWEKIDTGTQRFVFESDATIVLPLLLASLE